MTPNELHQRQQLAQSQPLVITATGSGFRVYSPANKNEIYQIGGSPQTPTCTCPDFQTHQNDPKWRCMHILAVMNQRAAPGTVSPVTEAAPASDQTPDEQEDGQVAKMLLKRSISPDGRIDSLSVEFAAIVPEGSEPEVTSRADAILALQETIVSRFLAGNGTDQTPDAPPAVHESPVIAELLNVGGMNGKYGRRLFLRFRVDGRVLRHFGSKTQLGDALTSAGYPELAVAVAEGAEFNLPCRVTTSRSPDGRYVNVDQVLPLQQTLTPQGGTSW